MSAIIMASLIGSMNSQQFSEFARPYPDRKDTEEKNKYGFTEEELAKFRTLNRKERREFLKKRGAK